MIEISDEVTHTRINGLSMSPFYHDGQFLPITKDISNIQLDDIIVFEIADYLQIKWIKGIGGSILSLKELTEKDWENWYHIYIDDKPVCNSQGKIFIIGKKQRDMLNGYCGRIPENRFLVLADIVVGDYDSTRFGLVSIDNVRAKIVK